jgi:phage FluMu gp28-like protein
VLACGRRWGKTTLGLDRLIHPALDGYPVGWFSPTYKMLADVWREAVRLLKPIASRINSQEHRLEMITGGLLDMWSLDAPDVARGRKYRRVVIDEAAMVPALEEAWNAVIRPSLADYAGDAWFCSTPKGFNYFHTLFTYGQDQTRSDWASWQMPTTANPFIPVSEVEEMRATLPERIFAQELLAQFLDDAGGIFRKVMAAATAPEQKAAIDGHRYAMGVDWGKHSDFTVITVIDVTTRQEAFKDRFNQIDYALQRQRLMALQSRFHCKPIIAEKNSMGEPIIEQLQREGLPVEAFTTTNASKAEAIEALVLAFEKDEIKILPDAVTIAELQAYEAERLPSGMLRYGAPEGMHDDTVMSLALAWQAVAHPPARLSVSKNPFY